MVALRAEWTDVLRELDWSQEAEVNKDGRQIIRPTHGWSRSPSSPRPTATALRRRSAAGWPPW